MLTRLPRRPPGLVATIVLCASLPATAQGPAAAWFLGVREGKHTAPTIPEDATRFEFAADGDADRLRGSAAGGGVVQNGQWRAYGAVIRVTADTVELVGKYDASSFPAVVGRAITYTLKGSAEALEGHRVGSRNAHFPITLRRPK